jgi:ribonuclease E
MGEAGDEPAAGGDDDAEDPADPALSEQPEIAAAGGDAPRARRRGRRGGRRRRRDGQPGGLPLAAEGDAGSEMEGEVEEDIAPAPVPLAPQAYVGPTPADPFAGQALDIFDLMERAEQAQLAAPPPPPARARAGEVMVEEMALEPVAQAMPAGEVEAGAPAEPQGIEVPRQEPETMAATAENSAAALVPPPVNVDAAPVAPEARKRGWWRK